MNEIEKAYYRGVFNFVRLHSNFETAYSSLKRMCV